jgi:hypothetical protein
MDVSIFVDSLLSLSRLQQKLSIEIGQNSLALHHCLLYLKVVISRKDKLQIYFQL